MNEEPKPRNFESHFVKMYYNRSEAAEILGISREMVTYFMFKVRRRLLADIEDLKLMAEVIETSRKRGKYDSNLLQAMKIKMIGYKPQERKRRKTVLNPLP